MKLSIITINYNNAEGLSKTLASVFDFPISAKHMCCGLKQGKC